MARIVDAIGLWKKRRLSCSEAADLIGCSARHFLRLREAYEAEGAEGIIDRRRGRASARRAPLDEIEWVIAKFRTRHFDFNTKHFHELIHGQSMGDGRWFGRSYSWTKGILRQRGLVRGGRPRGKHRTRREPSALPGMMLFQDGSRHAWLPSGPPLDLIVTLDDATGMVTSLFLVEEEGMMSSFRGLRETIERYGLFGSLYTDRGSHYFVTPKAGEAVDKSRLTQVGRALSQLGISQIPSYSPQARGRIERMMGTLQGRLKPLLRLSGLTGIAEANRWLEEVFRSDFNRRFARPARQEGTAFIPCIAEIGDILCEHSERVVGNDNTVTFDKLRLQIPEQAHRRHLVKATVRVHRYPDHRLALFHGPRKLAEFQADGRFIDHGEPRKAAA
jgi:hypothetical protein